MLTPKEFQYGRISKCGSDVDFEIVAWFRSSTQITLLLKDYMQLPQTIDVFFKKK